MARSFVLVVLLLLTACAPAAPGRPTAGDTGGSALSQPRVVPQKPIVVAFSTEVDVLEPSMNAGTGNRDFDALTNSFLAYLDPQQRPMPFLAEELPTVEKGTWKVFPDGRMETTYRLKKHPTWHDGVPITAHDFVFAHGVRRDPTVAMRPIVEARVSLAQALDDHTLYLEWKEPFIWAGMISPEYFAPLPRHRLEEMYATDKVTFRDGPHWRTEWVGSGPYRLENWEQGVEMRLRAHEGFAFGKPPVDQLIFRFIADANTVVANLLAGNADVAFHSSIGFSQNQSLEQAGWAGTTEYWSGNPRYLEFQQRDWGNLQRAALDRRVRRASLHAIDRQAIVDGLYAGKARPTHVWLSPSDPAYPAVERAITKYEFDPPRAEALLAEAGWVKGGDGMARRGGETLHLPLLNQSGEIDQLEAAVIVNYWKAVGIASEIQVLSRAQQGDGEFRARFPAVAYSRITIDYEAFPWLRSKIATPENRWVGTNRIGYYSQAVDEHWTRALGTISDREREPLLVEALKAMTADAVVTVTHLQPRPMAYRAGLTGPKETWVGESALVWNSWEWQWK